MNGGSTSENYKDAGSYEVANINERHPHFEALTPPAHQMTTLCIPEHFELSVPHSQPGSRRMTIHDRESMLSPPTRNLQQKRRSSTYLTRQKQLFLDILHSKNVLGSSRLSINTLDKSTKSEQLPMQTKPYNTRLANDNLTTVLSAFYCKFIVVLGIAFPVTDILSPKAPQSFYQGFYLYLYLVSVAFVGFMFFAHLRQKAEFAAMLYSYRDKVSAEGLTLPTRETQQKRYGSFYLRIGAVAFGIGSMVYSGLEFGQYFELKMDPRCQNSLIALTPAARMLLTIVQMHFIFLNTQDTSLKRHRFIARFGLMHMIATNLCEWLYVLVEETRHEIVHLANKHSALLTTNFASEIIDGNATALSHHIEKRATALEIVVECRRTNIMGSLVQNAAPFLFPCTIEYSLICAVTLLEMWKQIRGLNNHGQQTRQRKISSNDKGANQFSIDCTSAHRGLFAGILVIVLTIISLIMYFQLSENVDYLRLAIFEVTITEALLCSVSSTAVLAAMYYVRDLKLSRSHSLGLSLDCNLLVVAQSGSYIYAMFSIVGSYFSMDSDPDGVLALVTEVLRLLETSMQTLFILNAWWRRCRSSSEIRRKPGREIVTYLIVANMALWTINTLIKGRAMFRPTHLQFFGEWAWTIITHVAMPLEIFYRFHSTICLFEIWKTTYKANKNPLV